MANRIFLKDGGLTGSVPAGFKTIGISSNGEFGVQQSSGNLSSIRDYVTDVQLSGTDLVFSATGSAFSGNIDLSSLGGGGGGDVSIDLNSNLFADFSGTSSTTGTNNVALGNSALVNNTTGFSNVALGFESLRCNTTGNNNVALGDRSLQQNTTSNSNIAIGKSTLEYNTGSSNIGIGYRVLRNQTTGSNNIALGSEAMSYCTNTGSDNVALGRYALKKNTSGTDNISIGRSSMLYNQTGNLNVSVGASSQSFSNNGNKNVSIGAFAMAYGYGSNNVSVGYNASGGQNTRCHTVVIGYQATSGAYSSTIVLGSCATATANNQLVLGSSTHTVGPTAAESCTSNRTLSVRINGADYKLLLFKA